MGTNLIRTSDVNFPPWQVVNRLLFNSLQVAFANSTTVTQCKDNYNIPIVKGI